MKTFHKYATVAMLLAGIGTSGTVFAAAAGVSDGLVNAPFDAHVSKCGISNVSNGIMMVSTPTLLNSNAAGGAPALVQVTASSAASAAAPCVVIVGSGSLSTFPAGYAVGNATVNVLSAYLTGMNSAAAMSLQTAGAFTGQGFTLAIPTTNDQIATHASVSSTTGFINGDYQALVPWTIYH